MKFDFTNVEAWDPLKGGAPEEGPYEVVIKEVDPAHNAGKSTSFTVDLLSGKSKGGSTWVNIGNEPGPKGGNLKKWKTALMSVATALGKSEDDARKMISGPMEFDPKSTFTGKKAYIFVRSRAGETYVGTDGQEKTSGPQIDFLTKSQYDAAVAAEKAGGAPTGSNGSTGAQTATDGGGEKKSDVLGKLFG